MTKKLSELRDELAIFSRMDSDCALSFVEGFDAATTKLWPVIEELLILADEFPKDLIKIQQKLGIEGEK